jgi:methyl-accepting chemotaxis protein
MATTEGHRNQRKLKNLLINPQFQLRYIFWLTWTGLMLFIFFAINLYVHVKENYSVIVDLSPMPEEAKYQLHRELHVLAFKLGIGSLFFLGAVAIVGLVMSHRAAGPMYHFKRVFEGIKAGKLDERVHLRPKDDFIDVAHSFNEMMDSLQKKS